LPYVSLFGARFDVLLFLVELIVFYLEVFIVFCFSLVPVFW
jgi:hypothetical protein